jgi:hypothetical protein
LDPKSLGLIVEQQRFGLWKRSIAALSQISWALIKRVTPSPTTSLTISKQRCVLETAYRQDAELGTTVTVAVNIDKHRAQII